MIRSHLYLSGAIEYCKDPNSWRKKMYKKLFKNYRVFIPDPAIPPFDKEEPEYKSWVKENFIIPDMNQIVKGKYFFVKLDKETFEGAGTVSELTLAAWKDKHIVVFLDGINEEDIPGWCLGCLDDAIFVDSIDNAIKYYIDLAIKEERKLI